MAWRHGDRFLADVEVEEAPDLARAVEFCALLFKPSDAEHLAEQLNGMLTIYNATHRCPILCASVEVDCRTLTLPVLTYPLPANPVRGP